MIANVEAAKLVQIHRLQFLLDANVRFSSNYVRFTPVNGHSFYARKCPLLANTGHPAVLK